MSRSGRTSSGYHAKVMCPGSPLTKSGAHVGDRIVELVLERPLDVVLEGIDGKPIAIAQPVQFEHLRQERRDPHQLVEHTVGDDEKLPPVASIVAR